MKKALPIVIIAVVALGLGAWFLLGRGKGGPTVTLPGGIEKEAGEEGESFAGKLKDMVARGVPLKCTSTQGDYTGTTYIKGKKVYGEVSSQGKEAFLIMVDNCMWTWNKDENQGVKMCFDEDVWEMEEDPTVPTAYEYRCSPAVVPDSKFVPPTNVNFMDMEQMMQEMQGM